MVSDDRRLGAGNDTICRSGHTNGDHVRMRTTRDVQRWGYPALMPPAEGPSLTTYNTTEAAGMLDELCVMYADAYGVAQESEKISAFRNRATAALERPRYGLLTARDGEQLVGFVGCALAAGSSWWNGLSPAPAARFHRRGRRPHLRPGRDRGTRCLAGQRYWPGPARRRAPRTARAAGDAGHQPTG